MVTVNELDNNNELLAMRARSERLVYSPCPFQGTKIPIYCICYQQCMGKPAWEDLSCTPGKKENILDALLLSQWEDRMLKGCFKYDVTMSEIRVIDGKIKFFAQLNEWKMTDLSKIEYRKLHHPEDPIVIDSMKHQEELLFCVTSSDTAKSELIASADVPNTAILVIMNATPLEYGHIFIVPCCSSRLDETCTARYLEMVVRVAVEINNHSFRLFYDYSRNKYFQACYFPDLLPVEQRPIDAFFCNGKNRTEVRICSILDYPIKALLFESFCNIKLLVETTSEILSLLCQMNIPCNFLISDCGRRVFLFPLKQRPADLSSVSAWECGGSFLFTSRHEYDQITEEVILNRLSTFSLDDEAFDQVKQLCCSIASSTAI